MKKKYNYGFVYVLTNECMPGLVKIGLTTFLPEDRSKQLCTTGVPMPFEVEFRIMTSSPKALEARAHELMKNFRVNNKREFFNVSVEEAIDAVRTSAFETASIDSWSSSEICKLHNNEKTILSLEKGQVFALLSYSHWNSSSPELIDIWQSHSNGDQLEFHSVDSMTNISSFSENDPYSEEDPMPYLDRSGQVVNGMINGREVMYPGERLVWLPSYNSRATQSYVIFEAKDPVQVISRTWSPQLSPDGISLLLNYFLYDAVWTEAKEAVHKAMSLSRPRVWAPRGGRGPEWEDVGSTPQPPNFWLPQLTPKKNVRKKAYRQSR